MAVIRDANGKVLPDSNLNPAGTNQHQGHGERLAAQARTLLDRETTQEALEALGLSAGASSPGA